MTVVRKPAFLFQMAHLDNGGRVGRDKELAQMVDDHLLLAVGTHGGAHNGAQIFAGLNVSQHGCLQSIDVRRSLRKKATGVRREIGGAIVAAVPVSRDPAVRSA